MLAHRKKLSDSSASPERSILVSKWSPYNQVHTAGHLAQPGLPRSLAVATFAGQRSLLKGHVQRLRSDRLCFRPGSSPAFARWQAAKRRILTCAKARGKQKIANQTPAVITAPLKVWSSSFTRQSETLAHICSCTESLSSRAEGGQAAACMAQVQVKEQLTPVEKLSMAPFWSTFCGTSNGAWQGVQAAFSPVTGQARALLPHPGVSCSCACTWQ